MLYASRPSKVKVSQELVDWIQSCWPEEKPVPHNTLNEIMYQAGQQSIIEWLRGQQVSNAVEAFDNRSMT